MKDATAHFRQVPRGHGVAYPEDFVLVKVGTADAQGHTFFALVHRPYQTIRIRDAAGKYWTMTERDDAFYHPYRTDAGGVLLDVPIDWAAVPRTTGGSQAAETVAVTPPPGAIPPWRAGHHWAASFGALPICGLTGWHGGR